METTASTKLLVRYQVRPECVVENEAAIGAVFAELAGRPLPGLDYRCLKLGDGLTFVHIIEAPPATHQLFGGLASFQAFSQGVRKRCDAPPVVQSWEAVGLHRPDSRT